MTQIRSRNFLITLRIVESLNNANVALKFLRKNPACPSTAHGRPSDTWGKFSTRKKAVKTA